MKIFDFLRNSQRRTAAQVAKERLQIIVSHENAHQGGPDIINQLQKELLEVISKYINIDPEQIKVQLERNKAQSVLELNVTLPDAGTLKQAVAEKARNDARDETNKENNSSSEKVATKNKEQSEQSKRSDKEEEKV